MTGPNSKIVLQYTSHDTLAVQMNLNLMKEVKEVNNSINFVGQKGLSAFNQITQIKMQKATCIEI